MAGICPRFAPLRTQVTREPAKTIITRNDSPDISFDRSINPYRGCEHGVSIVSRGRPMPISACRLGSIFETRLFSKINAQACLSTNYRRGLCRENDRD